MKFRIKFQVAGEHFLRTVHSEHGTIVQAVVAAEEVAVSEQIRREKKIDVMSVEVEVSL